MISVIIPVYNVEPYIEKCLLSIINQTYTGGLEVILVDDCGHDDSIETAKLVIAQNTRSDITFRICRHEHNRGLSAARNTGLEAATGEFVAFVDSDDWLEPGMYEGLSKKLENDPDALFITSSFTVETSQGPIYACSEYVEGSTMTPYQFLQLMLSVKTNNTAWNKLYRRSFITMPFQEGRICEDYLFFFDNLIGLINSDQHIMVTSQVYYHNLSRDGSITNQGSDSEKLWWLDWMENMAVIADKCKERYPELYDIQIDTLKNTYNSHFWDIVRNKAMTGKRKRTLANINRYARIVGRENLPVKTRLAMFIATHVPCGYGYTLLRNIDNAKGGIRRA